MNSRSQDDSSYQILCRTVLERDGWRCQNCGSMSNLQVHHQRFRAQGGGDSQENLLTLCANRHEDLHLNRCA